MEPGEAVGMGREVRERGEVVEFRRLGGLCRSIRN